MHRVVIYNMRPLIAQSFLTYLYPKVLKKILIENNYFTFYNLFFIFIYVSFFLDI